MRVVRYLQHWLSGSGARLQVTDFVPIMYPIRQWADTFPWVALVHAIEQSFAKRFPKTSPRGRRPVPIRVLLALELLKHEWGASEEDICHRWRTDFAVMYACGLQDYQGNPSPAYFVLPETLCEFRSRIDEALMDELLAIQAAAAMDAGLVSPAHLVIATCPADTRQPTGHRCHHTVSGSKKPSSSSRTSHAPAATAPLTSRSKRQVCIPTCKSPAALWPPVPWSGPGVREDRPPNRTTAPGPRRADHSARSAGPAGPDPGGSAA
jgi:hypothetical protein